MIKTKQYINLLKSLYLNIPSPISVSINLTNKCNQHCIYCEVGQGLVKTEKPLLVLDDLKWIIDEMNLSGIPTLGLGGGEPLLFKDIFEVIQYAHKFGIRSSVMTNMMMIRSTIPRHRLERGFEGRLNGRNSSIG